MLQMGPRDSSAVSRRVLSICFSKCLTKNQSEVCLAIDIVFITLVDRVAHCRYLSSVEQAPPGLKCMSTRRLEPLVVRRRGPEGGIHGARSLRRKRLW